MSVRTLASLLFALTACAKAPIVPSAISPFSPPTIAANEESLPSTQMQELSVTIRPRSGSSTTGHAVFRQTERGVSVEIAVKGASPGLHGIAVHDRADCTASDAASAGGHFDPDGHPHGLPVEDRRHLGDLGNLSVAPDGTGRLTMTIADAVLGPGSARSLIGRAIVISADADDGSERALTGERVGCGELVPPQASN